MRDPLVDKIRLQVAQSDEQQRVDALLGLEEMAATCRTTPSLSPGSAPPATAGDARRPRGRRPRAEFQQYLRLCGQNSLLSASGLLFSLFRQDRRNCYNITFIGEKSDQNHLITGFLGSGKTTSILHLLAQKPADENGRTG